MIIDSHTHIFPKVVIKERGQFFSDPSFSLLYSSEKSRLAGVDDLLNYISENGLHGAVAMSFPWRDSDFCRVHNEYMESSASDAPGKVFPFGMVPYGDVKSVRKIAGEIKSAGLYGIGELAFYETGLDEGSEKFLREVFEAAVDLSLPVCLHLNEPVGHIYPGKYEPSLAAVYRLLTEYRACRVILSHWGGGMFFYELMPEVRESLSNVWYDTAATPYIYSPDVYRVALGIVPPEKILFGSDYPLLGIKRYMNNINDYSGEDKNIRLIMGENTASLLGV